LTNGNVLRLYCGFMADDISAVGEVNPDEFGRLTPDLLPIVLEGELRARPGLPARPAISEAF
jgi:hypothetical protein